MILDPGNHEDGLPAVIFDDESRQIEIPPTLHVHRYYKSGDKGYQGPIINGGPTIMVAQYPKTGERINVDVMLPHATPEIVYTKKTSPTSIRTNASSFSFCPLFSNHVKVASTSCATWGRIDSITTATAID